MSQADFPATAQATFERTFPTANRITLEVADWIESNVQTAYDPLLVAASLIHLEASEGRTIAVTEAIEEVTRTYIEDNDEAWWSQAPAAEVLAQLDECRFDQLAFQFAPRLRQLQAQLLDGNLAVAL